jgi:mycothiol S-conjugate amidase
LVEIIRKERPHVLVTYDENGFYGHPDHVRANQITVAAFDAAGDPNRFGDAGEPWDPIKLYYNAIPHSRMIGFAQRLREHGVTPPFEVLEGELPPFGTPDELVTTIVDVSAEVERKRQALLAHATQMGPEVFFAQLPPVLFDELFGTESFLLVKSRRPIPTREDDLFADLRTNSKL